MPEREPRQHASPGPDPLLVEGVLEEETDAEEARGPLRRGRATSCRAALPTGPRPGAGPVPARRRGSARPTRPPASRSAARSPSRSPRRGGRGRDGRRPSAPGASRRVRPARRRSRRPGEGDAAMGLGTVPSTPLARPSCAALQLEQAGLEPPHLAAEAQEHQDEDEDDDRGGEEEQAQCDQRDDRQPRSCALAAMIAPDGRGASERRGLERAPRTGRPTARLRVSSRELWVPAPPGRRALRRVTQGRLGAGPGDEPRREDRRKAATRGRESFPARSRGSTTRATRRRGDAQAPHRARSPPAWSASCCGGSPSFDFGSRSPDSSGRRTTARCA